jgi:N-ethylmaleimide reductase
MSDPPAAPTGPSLFTPIQLGAITAANRIFMSPMTRGRATREHVPTELMTSHYRQRAGAGLIISEATGISREGLGWPYAPGIWAPEQIGGWQAVTREVHEAGGKIFCQLWHMGRLVHPDFRNGAPPVAPSRTTAPRRARTYSGPASYVEARALETDEIAAIVRDFAQAAKNAFDAGFDGIQIHAGSGYLLEQFMRDGTNHRSDAYGGSIANRLRFITEVLDAVCDAIGADRVSVRFSPNVTVSGCEDSDPTALFSAAVEMLQPRQIAFLELREAGTEGVFGAADMAAISPLVRQLFTGPLVLNEEYSRESATAAIAQGQADAISFGRPFIANPDLPERFRRGASLASDVRELWYTQDATGYTDYPPA